MNTSSLVDDLIGAVENLAKIMLDHTNANTTLDDLVYRQGAKAPTFLIQPPEDLTSAATFLPLVALDQCSAHARLLIAKAAEGAQQLSTRYHHQAWNAPGSCAAWRPGYQIAHTGSHFQTTLSCPARGMMVSTNRARPSTVKTALEALLRAIEITLPPANDLWTFHTHLVAYPAADPAQAAIMGAALFQPDMLDDILDGKMPDIFVRRLVDKPALAEMIQAYLSSN